MQKIGHREIYAGVILLSSSLLLLTLVILSFIGDLSNPGSLSYDQILKRSFGLLLTVLGVKGGMQLLMRKNRGWVISISLLCFFTGIMAYGFIADYFTGVEIITAVIIESMLVLGVVFLLSGRTRQKFSVSKKNIAPVVFLTGSLALLYISMQ